MRRTWKRRASDGTFFRNCPMILQEMNRTHNPIKFAKLQDEWEECWRAGTIKTDKIGRFDRWVEFDDSPEATNEWVKKFLATGKP